MSSNKADQWLPGDGVGKGLPRTEDKRTFWSDASILEGWLHEYINLSCSLKCTIKYYCTSGTSRVVQWLRLHVLNGGGLVTIPGQGTRSHRLQLKIPHVGTAK